MKAHISSLCVLSRLLPPAAPPTEIRRWPLVSSLQTSSIMQLIVPSFHAWDLGDLSTAALRTSPHLSHSAFALHPHHSSRLVVAGIMGIKGVRVLTFSPMEMKAFGGFYYEMKKKVLWHYGNISSTWSSMVCLCHVPLAFTRRPRPLRLACCLAHLPLFPAC